MRIIRQLALTVCFTTLAAVAPASASSDASAACGVSKEQSQSREPRDCCAAKICC
jgi:hypothetical protein